MQFAPIVPAKRCLFRCPATNKSQTVLVFEHTTVLDVLRTMNLVPDGTYQIFDGEQPVGLQEAVSPHVVNGQEVTVHRHPKAPPISGPAANAVSW